ALRDEAYGGILPQYSAVIFDEAHEVEDIAGQYFGMTLSNYQVQELIKDCASSARRKHFGTPELDRALIYLGDRSTAFFSLFTSEGRLGFRDQVAFLERNADAYRELLVALDLLDSQLELVPQAIDETGPLVRRTRLVRQALEFWLESGDTRFVYWTD